MLKYYLYPRPKWLLWWSGGVTSAIAVKEAIELAGPENCRIIFIDTFNEHLDTYRFKQDCEKWYGIPIETASRIPYDYKSIVDVWILNCSLNVAHGAICSSELKREIRYRIMAEYNKTINVFGFDMEEPHRALAMTLNYPNANPVYPLLFKGYTKKRCIEILNEAGIKIPIAYILGYNNNNCLETGCVQDGIGYWQKIKREMPHIFDMMADLEHYLTWFAKRPVTMLRVEIKGVKYPLFLKPCREYEGYPKFEDRKGRSPKPLTDCNGFCGTNDLSKPNPTQLEINYQEQ